MIRKSLVVILACWLSAVLDTSVVCADAPILEGLDTNKPMILPLKVSAAYNTDTMFFNIQWVGDRGDTHDLLQFTNDAWQKDGTPRREGQSTIDGDSARGPTNVNSTNYESRVTWMINDPNGPNAVDNFSNVGCFCTCHDDSRAMPEWDPSTNKSKYLNEGTEGSLDLWHHRQARANPIGASDDQYVTQVGPDPDKGGRFGDAGSGPYQVNNFVDGHPTWVLDNAQTEAGEFAFDFADTHDSPNRSFTAPGTPELGAGAVPQSMDWDDAVLAGYIPEEGDTVPRRRLRTPTGSRGDITAFGTTFTPNDLGDDHSIGTIESSTQRLLDTTHADDDTTLAAGGLYDIAFAVHTGMVTVRDHYVGFAMTLGLGVDADIEAEFFDGAGNETLPDWESIVATDVNLFLPGITSLEFLEGKNEDKIYERAYGDSTPVDQIHGGSGAMGGTSCTTCHVAADSELAPGVGFAGSMEALAWQRGGVWTPTPLLIPEPIAATMMIIGLVGIGWSCVRKGRKVT